MEYHIHVENIKCGGCVASISKNLSALAGVDAVQVNVEKGEVRFESSAPAEVILAQVKTALLKMGYPERGSLEGMQAVGVKAKSFVSCAIGKMAKSE
ncbi:hypothetical protein THMIRHAS_03650 [Thiosulfatimonas sediminis]|uniref:HMA domain-containing protein n=1 Tax=Thiosulfatimonas sediminis TaxID=2675054 RepID=A0A6F8PS82_9GAMM|nr:heavy-metal-associated domain-containing protein [Thiosulfatimonas sediminis]BBP44992.1 hypothetical protein THMIRHAS_03650 [Thiosulfatimonas sediminis]